MSSSNYHQKAEKSFQKIIVRKRQGKTITITIATGHPSKLTYTRFSKRHRPETDVRHTKPRPAKIVILAFRFFGYAGHFRGRCGENTGPGWLCSCRECGRFPCEIQCRKVVSCTIHCHHLRASKRVPIAVGLFSLSVSGSRSRLKYDDTHAVLRKFSSVSAHKLLLTASQ